MTILFDSVRTHKPSPEFGVGVDLSGPAPASPSAADRAWWEGCRLGLEGEWCTCPFAENDPCAAAWKAGYVAGGKEWEALMDRAILLAVPADLIEWEVNALDR